MRIWTVHPSLLDVKGFVACWRETLLAQAVLQGKTNGWTKHPQLDRFKAHPDPIAAVATYLEHIHKESKRRNYNFDASKILPQRTKQQVKVSKEFLAKELADLKAKLKVRDPARYNLIKNKSKLDLHPSFKLA